MEERRNRMVGTDNENNDTIRRTLMGVASQNAAQVYSLANKGYVPDERVWEINGRRIEVIVRVKDE